MSIHAILRRFADTPDGVFGVLDLYDDAGAHLLRVFTGEDDWLDNQRQISCIEAGVYACERTIFLKHHLPTFEITSVPGRQRILIHPGNTEEDVEGCVLVGRRRGCLSVVDEDGLGRVAAPKWAVLESTAAFEDLMRCLTGVDHFPLVVQWATPGSWRTP